MLKQVQVAALGAVVLLAAGSASAQSAGGMASMHGDAAMLPMMTTQGAAGMAMHDAMMTRSSQQAAHDGWVFVGGEAGWALAPHAATAKADSPSSARSDLQARLAPTADGWVYVGGEAGWVVASHECQLANGKLVHSDRGLPLSTKAPRKPTAQELAEDSARYGGGA